MQKSDENPSKEIKYIKRGLLYGAAAGLATFGLAAAATMVFPASWPSDDAVRSETSALLDKPSVSSQVHIWQNERTPVVSETVQTKIAIVNLDEGIIADGKKIKYSDQILRLPDEKIYQFVSYSEARDGLKDGSFGAVIRIPASFSEHVESINGIPDPCILKYEISDLAGDSQRYVLFKKVNAFESMLSQDMSFLYISNMMTKYHEAQDGAREVMANDQADLLAVSDIEYADLVSMVEIKTFTSEELTAALPDLSTYTQNQTVLSAMLESRFEEALDEVSTACQQVFDQAGRLGVNMQIAAGETPQPLETGKIDDTEAITSVNTFLMTQLNDAVEVQKQSGAAEAEEIEASILRFKEVMQESIVRQNAVHHTAWQDTLETLTKQYKINLPVLAFQVDENEITFYYDGAEADPQSPVMHIFIQSENTTQDEDLECERTLQSELMYRIAAGAGDSEALVDDVLRDFEQEYSQELLSYGYANASDLLMSDLYESNSSCAASLSIEGDIDQMQAYILDKTFDAELLEQTKDQFMPFEDIAFSSIEKEEAYETDSESETDTLSGEIDKLHDSVQQRLEAEQSSFDQVITHMDEAVNQQASEMMHQQLTGQAEQTLAAVTEQANEIVERSNRLILALAKDTEEFQVYAASVAANVAVTDYQGADCSMEMNENYRGLLAACVDYSDEVQAFAFNLHNEAKQYGKDVEKNVAEIKSDTDQLLFAGLEEVRRQKQQSYDENQRLLSDFVNSLYYTRIGSRENSSLYRYIAAPVIIEESRIKEK